MAKQVQINSVGPLNWVVLWIIIIMGWFLLMHKSRVLLDESYGKEPLGLKLCINRQIIKLPNVFRWSQECQRWDATTQMRFEYCLENSLELQIYLSRNERPAVIAEGIVPASVLQRHLNEEVKVLLSYDGLVAGWLYCHFSVEGQECSFPENEKFFSIQKINLAFLEEIEEQIKIEIKQNCDEIYSKVFKLNQRSKTLFPNIKKSVRLSDVFKVEISLPNMKLKPIMFLVDHIKRGKNTTFDAWLRNKHKNRVGNMFLEYYMENLFLENERQLRTRKAIHPDSLEYAKTIAAKKINQKEIENEMKIEMGEREKDRKQLVIKKKIEEADRRIFKINTSVNMLLMEIKVNQGATPVMPCLRKSKATFNLGKEEEHSSTSLNYENEQRRVAI